MSPALLIESVKNAVANVLHDNHTDFEIANCSPQGKKEADDGLTSLEFSKAPGELKSVESCSRPQHFHPCVEVALEQFSNHMAPVPILRIG